ncbi:MAG TPA: hypothetical protein VN380_14170 [Thermoanaerobaculia bacterium]|nr:hypothetical protein [Thermoanaerobaculia bacterium]
MKKASETVDDDPLDHEIDFSKSRPNPYWLGMVDRRCVRLLASDLADAFPDDAAVNEALRTLLRTNAARTPKKISAKTVTAPGPKKTRT